jgi:hypothetical protein
MTEAQQELDLKELGKKVKDFERRLQEAIKIEHQPTILEKCPNMSAEAWEIVEELRELDKQYKLVVKSRLDELLTWPDDKLADADLFYNGKSGDVKFLRTKNWLEIMGFNKYNIPYTFTSRFDKKDVHVTFLVPDTLEPNDVALIMWSFHGGGFVRSTNSKDSSFLFANDTSVRVLETIFRGTLKPASDMREKLKQSG